MAILRIKRRAAGGAAGAPATLENAELAFNEQDLTLYYGIGTGGGGGSATSVIAIGGTGAFVDKTTSQTIAGTKTFSSDIVANITGNAATATILANSRTIAISGPITGTATSFNGSGNITIPVTALDVGHANVTGTLPVGKGGTGITSFTTGNYINAASSSTLQQRTPAQVLSDIGGAGSAITISAGNGLTGGGDLTTNRTITLGTPSTLTNATTNSVTGTTHTHAVTFPVNSVNSQTGTVVLNTSHVAESGNLYYTDARVRLNRLDQMATPTAAVSFGGMEITNVLDPTGAQSAATKAYVDSVAAGAGNAPFESVRAIAVANQALTGAATIDGVVLANGNRVLLSAQSTGSQNGIYVVNTGGAWTRAVDANASAEFPGGKQVFVNEGTTYGNSVWAITNDTAIVLGTDTPTFTQISGLGQISAGTGLSKSGNTLTNTDLGSSQFIFKNIAVSGQNTVVADSNNDTLTLVGSNITITTNDTTDTITFTGNAGTVTTASVVSANGFAGSVSNASTTPAITISTSVTGMLKGNGTAISAATAGTDYSGGTSALGTGILKSTTGTGALTIAVAGDFPTLNQNTTGSAATLTNARTIAISGPITGTATSFNGSANITIPVTALDVGHANVTGTLSYDHGGTGITTAPTPGGIVYGASGTAQGYSAAGTSGYFLVSGGAGAPTWTNTIDGGTF